MSTLELDGQADLFTVDHGAAIITPRARRTDPDTSHAAAARTSLTAASGRKLALDTHARHPRGLTDFELADLTGYAQTSIGVRRCELVRAGLIEKTDLRRPSPSGSPAIVWRYVK